MQPPLETRVMPEAESWLAACGVGQLGHGGRGTGETGGDDERREEGEQGTAVVARRMTPVVARPPMASSLDAT